ncbi:MAG TPA: LPXTG cell wall anchor domain-containing protein, partial [Propionibacteriaceae bacterium]|nr:LPXTG cell wall anchor domain-containing protein [Propionibacteriaceae bacterium]
APATTARTTAAPKTTTAAQAATTATPTVRVTTGTSTAVTLADTGSDVEGIVGLLAIATLVAGAALLLVRRRQHQA